MRVSAIVARNVQIYNGNLTYELCYIKGRFQFIQKKLAEIDCGLDQRPTYMVREIENKAKKLKIGAYQTQVWLCSRPTYFVWNFP